ncbi:DUF2188 domain-containing protein [Cellulophaga sp. L1A9]|uniref:DUF2188 domain-containing protein n=1 Tax=Cellulophaga sp. L1A9 TaxID=2686362 RepID=UPI00131EAFAF|nr:DUF2188 domain-containing protein [Cellulophaga sp. L1A9]
MSKKIIYTKKLGNKVAVSAKPDVLRKFHVINSVGRKWAVVADGSTLPTKVFTTKFKAIEFATKTACKIEGEVVIHKNTGEIEKRFSVAK